MPTSAMLYRARNAKAKDKKKTSSKKGKVSKSIRGNETATLFDRKES
jgi:hypothetical protein